MEGTTIGDVAIDVTLCWVSSPYHLVFPCLLKLGEPSPPPPRKSAFMLSALVLTLWSFLIE